MFSKELNDLIDFSISDGELDKKEKQLIYKKAIEEGVDIDELEIYLKSKIYGLKSKSKNNNLKTNKPEKKVKKENTQEQKLKAEVSEITKNVTNTASNAVESAPFFLFRFFIWLFTTLWRIITFPFKLIFNGCLGSILLFISLTMISVYFINN